MIVEGLKLMVIGMVTVYIFLIVLMFLVMLSARMFKNRFVTLPTTPISSFKPSQKDLAAVISAAIYTYKVKKQYKQ